MNAGLIRRAGAVGYSGSNWDMAVQTILNSLWKLSQ
jgi:hypothetical protein